MKREILLAPVSGIISSVYQPTGSFVSPNDTILNIEIMKLMYDVTSGISGKITLNVQEGEFVQEGQSIGEILGE